MDLPFSEVSFFIMKYLQLDSWFEIIIPTNSGLSKEINV